MKTHPLFEAALEFTLKNEGGFVNDPDDAGHATNFGISAVTLSQYRKKEITVDDVKNLTKEEAAAIYFSFYWLPNRCSEIEQPAIAIAIFDASILFGVVTTAMYAQEAVNAAKRASGREIEVDGVIGRRTLTALATVDPVLFVRYFRTLLLQRIESIITKHPKNEKFRLGWNSRVDRFLNLV